MKSRPHSALSRVMAKTDRNPAVAGLTTPQAFARWKPGIHAASEVADNVINIYDVIGEDWWTGAGFTLARLDGALRRIGDRAVEVHINSPGGDMFEGIGIYNRLKEHSAGVTVKVMGLAASAASIIAMAGTERLIGEAAFLMIHNCWVGAMGNRHDLREVADYLEPFDAAMADTYAKVSGQTAEDVAGWLDGETWMNGSLAIERGFATGKVDSAQITEDEAATARAQGVNTIRKTELEFCKSMSRTDARALIQTIKGTPDAALDPATPGAGDLSWMGEAARLSALLRS